MLWLVAWFAYLTACCYTFHVSGELLESRVQRSIVSTLNDLWVATSCVKVGSVIGARDVCDTVPSKEKRPRTEHFSAAAFVESSHD